MAREYLRSRNLIRIQGNKKPRQAVKLDGGLVSFWKTERKGRGNDPLPCLSVYGFMRSPAPRSIAERLSEYTTDLAYAVRPLTRSYRFSIGRPSSAS